MAGGPDDVTAPVDGWVQFAGEPRWSGARFTISPDDDTMRVDLSGGEITIDLREVTALDELLDGPVGYHHLEVGVGREPRLQAVWPPSFTDTLLTSLEATTVADLRPGRRSGAGVIGALALVGCGAIIVGALGLRHQTPARPAGTSISTETTIRIPATTVPAATDECLGVPTTTAVDVAVDVADGAVGGTECEPG